MPGTLLRGVSVIVKDGIISPNVMDLFIYIIRCVLVVTIDSLHSENGWFFMEHSPTPKDSVVVMMQKSLVTERDLG